MTEFIDDENSDEVFDAKERRLRKLTQYRDLTDEEFKDMMARKRLNAQPVKDFETRISTKMKQFEDDYDISDLKVNDLMTLRALCQASITLDDLEQESFRLRADGYDENTLFKLEKLSKIMSETRADISTFSNDLRITRKLRKGEKEQTVLTYIEDLKQKAKKFYEAKSAQIFCPKCNTLIANVWALYPESKNRYTFTCSHINPDGSKCGEVISLTSKDLLEMGQTNKQDIPESLK